MAEKRMFSRSVVSSDPFLDMPKDAQCLYFQLNLAADDRGICDCPRRVMRSCGASDDSMRLLIAKKFVLIPKCNDQVVVIKHWRINNNMRSQRFKETKHMDVLSELFYDENKSYSQNPGDGHVPCLTCADVDLLPDGKPMVNQWSTTGLPSADQRCTQNRVEQSRVEQSREEENNNNPIYLSDSEKIENDENAVRHAAPAELKTENIKKWKGYVDTYKRLGFPTDSAYAMALADGVTRDEIDNFDQPV